MAIISWWLRFLADFNQSIRVNSEQLLILVIQPGNPFQDLMGWLIGN